LADAQGRQPVVHVDTYEEPYALPVASNVDRFFDTYSRYLEAAVAAAPDYLAEGAPPFSLPWGVPELLARDEALVESLRAGRFNSLMLADDLETQAWIAKVLGASR
jgi:hypothetical protein